VLFRQLPENDKEVVREALKRILLETRGEITICSPYNEYSDDPFNCNVVRGKMWRIELDKGIVRVKTSGEKCGG